MDELAKQIFETARLTGSFVLRSGKTSHEYFDKYLFESNPIILKEIASRLSELIPSHIEILAGIEMGGIPVATAISIHANIPAVFVRKKAKNYGTCKFAEGADIKGKRLCIIEDVITTGGQVLLSTNDLRNEGAVVEDVICVIERDPEGRRKLEENGLKLYSLFTMDELFSAAKIER